VVSENGLVFCRPGDALDALMPGRSVADGRRALDPVARAFATRHGLQETADDHFRIFERTYLRPAGADAARIGEWRAELAREGAGFLASSIHLHVRPLGWGKGQGAGRAISRLIGSVRHEAVLAIGDSGNDADLFRTYALRSVGVANVRSALGELGGDAPRYVTAGDAADGFLEVAAAILAARGGLP
jgi:hydroxymethylpyrimidine pyrophosphatase-like HAD family hydrolase